MGPHLRVFWEPEVAAPEAPAATVSVRLGDMLPLLAMAQQGRFNWLRDFLDDEVRITDDLYNVLQEFAGYRPTSA
jgi:hypothetical protein